MPWELVVGSGAADLLHILKVGGAAEGGGRGQGGGGRGGKGRKWGGGVGRGGQARGQARGQACLSACGRGYPARALQLQLPPAWAARCMRRRQLVPQPCTLLLLAGQMHARARLLAAPTSLYSAGPRLLMLRSEGP
jgi:hypothetical protein